MAVRNVLVRATPDEVWAVLSDGRSYAEWVVGTSEIRHVDPGWPEAGSSLHYTVDIGPLHLEDRTTVRIVEPSRRLELEATAAPFGSARVAIQVLPWDGDSVVILDEHPLRGPRALWENPVADLLLRARTRLMVRNLSRVVERRSRRGA